MMRTIPIGLALLFGLGLTSCAHWPMFSQVADTLPPVPAGEARVYVYRPFEAYESLEVTLIYVDGKLFGNTRNGAVLYRDVPAGRHVVAIFSRGKYPGQTQILTVVPQQVAYIDVESITNFNPSFPEETFVLRFLDSATGSARIQPLWFIDG